MRISDWSSDVCSSDLKPCRLGEADELLVRGDMVFAGYYKDPDQTDRVFQDGWLKTGDVAALEGGMLRIVDRLKDIMITAGGKKIGRASGRERVCQYV